MGFLVVDDRLSSWVATAAVARWIDDEWVRGYFTHQGHRTAESQRALQAHADPWLGYTELGGVGQLVAEVFPYAADLDWPT